MKARLLLLVMMLVVSSSLDWGTSYAQSPNFIYSEIKGHTISGAFLEFYLRAPNPKEIYGEPITEAFTDPKTNLLIQYFEKARFEYHPAGPTGHQVQMTPLGNILYQLSRDKGVPSKIFSDASGCRVFPDTGLRVCRAFLAFFKENGSEYTFGPPITNAIAFNERIVQYFFYAKLEWHPDLPTGKSIVVSDLGYEYFYEAREDPTRLEPIYKTSSNSTIDGVLSLEVAAIPQFAISPLQGHQTLYIYVSDQRRVAVSGAQVVLVVQMPSGEESRYIVPELTDQYGVTRFTFPFKSASVGMAEIKVIVTRDTHQSDTVTSYHIWW